jgi:hypothetical protein
MVSTLDISSQIAQMKEELLRGLLTKKKESTDECNPYVA